MIRNRFFTDRVRFQEGEEVDEDELPIGKVMTNCIQVGSIAYFTEEPYAVDLGMVDSDPDLFFSLFVIVSESSSVMFNENGKSKRS